MICVPGHLRYEKDPLRAARALRRLRQLTQVRLVQAGILAQKDSDQAAADLAQARAAAVTSRRAQQLATLRAPLAGVVTAMSAVLGASVDPSQSVPPVSDGSLGIGSHKGDSRRE